MAKSFARWIRSATYCVCFLHSSGRLHAYTYFRPQSSPTAIIHLLKASSTFLIMHDAENEDTVTAAWNEAPDLSQISSFKIPWSSLWSLIRAPLPLSPPSFAVARRPSMASTAFYFHSSGTTGVPKLIPQTHNGAVGILPLLQSPSSPGPRIATITTTPLYSGGIADLLRAWSAASPLWIFPENRAPIIGSTVLSIITQIDKLSEIHIERSSRRSSAVSTDAIECVQPLTLDDVSEVEDLALARAWRLGYLSCVPFVLENLVETPELKRRLLVMDAVGVGGAAMPKVLGDRLVIDGVRLVSRFGSSECGFLLSSYRKYDEDNRWDVLRVPSATGLQFKNLEGGDGKCELIVLEAWPMVSTAVHAARPFNTHDVFIPHETIHGAWTYAGRSDTQITLKTGKKFDPVPIEDALRQCNLVEDVIVVGDDRPFPAAIFIPSLKYHSSGEEQRRFDIWKRVKWVNGRNPSHAKIGEWCWIVLNEGQGARVRRNPKGGVVRSAIEKDFEKELKQIYGTTNQSDGKGEMDKPIVQLAEDVAARIKLIVQDLFDHTVHLEEDFDFFDAGVDSAMSIQIRRKICDLLPEEKQKEVPLNVIYECGTVHLLVQFVKELFNDPVKDDPRRKSVIEMDEKLKKHQEMLSMVEQYVSAQPQLLDKSKSHLLHRPMKTSHEHQGTAVLLTGATGFLGAHILNLLIHDSSVTRIFVCIRGSHLVPYEKQQERAKARISSTMASHKFALEKCREDAVEKIMYVPFFLNEPDLGVPAEVYTTLVEETTHVIHAAWEVNFNLPLKTFASQVEGTVNLFNLLILSNQCRKSCNQLPRRTPSMFFCSSVASVANMQWTSSAKPLSADPSDAADLGYGQSKWTAESVLRNLAQRNAKISVSILRVGQLSGSTTTGIWNSKEAWPLMFDASLNIVGKEDRVSRGSRRSSGASTSPLLIVLPDMASTAEPPLDWLPVDIAAREIFGYMKMDGEAGVRVLQVSNDGSASPTWTEAQAWILAWAKQRGLRSTVVSPECWLRGIEASSVEHQAKALVPLWRKNWLSSASGQGKYQDQGGSKEVARKDSKSSELGEVVQGDGKVEEGVEISEEYLRGILDWIVQSSEG
jgi:nucleoside-diphosphate-sugar epimerase/acyl-CoA synthetase (AMP-forming)/AMP-acid ligase II